MAANEDIRAERSRGPDPYDDEPEDDFVDDDMPPKRSGRVLPIVVASLAIFGFVVIVYYAYQQGIRAGSEQNPPIIKAEEGPSKVRPASPGGMDVPNQGMKVYELGKSGSQQAAAPGGVERILPKAEEPMPRPPAPPEPATTTAAPPAPPAPAAAPTTPVTVAPSLPVLTGNAATSSAAAPASQTSGSAQSGVLAPPPPPLPGSGRPMPTVADNTAAASAAARPNGPSAPQAPPPAQPPRDDAQASQPRGLTLGGRAPGGMMPPLSTPSAPAQQQTAAAPQRTQTAATSPTPSAGGGSSHVQLMAGKSLEEANAGWKRISAKHKDLLGSLSMETQTVDVPGKGTFFRVLAGPVSKPDAEKLCESLKTRGQDCIVR
jgi:hypothetical protein